MFVRSSCEYSCTMYPSLFTLVFSTKSYAFVTVSPNSGGFRMRSNLCFNDRVSSPLRLAAMYLSSSSRFFAYHSPRSFTNAVMRM